MSKIEKPIIEKQDEAVLKHLKAHRQISKKRCFEKYGYTLTELFGKPDNWLQIYKQTSSNFYTSNNVSRRTNYS